MSPKGQEEKTECVDVCEYGEGGSEQTCVSVCVFMCVRACVCFFACDCFITSKYIEP